MDENCNMWRARDRLKFVHCPECERQRALRLNYLEGSQPHFGEVGIQPLSDVSFETKDRKGPTLQQGRSSSTFLVQLLVQL